MRNIFNFIRTHRNEYEQRSIPLFEGYEYSQYDLINQINHYWLDSYLEESARDDIIGQYPFDNISKFRVLLEARATDFDTKHIEVAPLNSSREARVASMIATKALHKHMRDINFGQTLNDICITRPKYGGVIAKKTSDGVHVAKWENLITDQSDIMAGSRIDRYYMSPSEILEKKGAWKNVEQAIKTAEDFREKDVAETGTRQADTLGDLIEVFEIQGDVPVSMLKMAQNQMNGENEEITDEDENTYKYVRIVACGADWVEGKKDNRQENGIVLYAEEEEPSHKYLARNPVTGRGLGEGVVESLFEHQKWHNFTKTEEMRMIAIAGKKLYVTDDPDILSNIFDEGVDHGTVLRVTQGKMFQELNQVPTGTPIYQSIRAELNESADKVTSSFASMLGEQAKSGTPFRSQYLQNLEASSQFQQYREEIGFFVKEIVEDWLLPEALENLAKDDEIFDSFSAQELQLIDETIKAKALTNKMVELTMNKKAISPEVQQEMQQQIDKVLRQSGSKRTITKVKDYIMKANKQVIIHTTDEQRSKQVLFESYANLLGSLSPQDPRRNALIDKIMEAIGITPEELELYVDNAVPGSGGQIDPQSLQLEEQSSGEQVARQI